MTTMTRLSALALAATALTTILIADGASAATRKKVTTATVYHEAPLPTTYHTVPPTTYHTAPPTTYSSGTEHGVGTNSPFPGNVTSGTGAVVKGNPFPGQPGSSGTIVGTTQTGGGNPPSHPCPLTSGSGCSGPPRAPLPPTTGGDDHDHDHDHHHGGLGIVIEGAPGEVVVPSPVAVAPAVAAPVVAAPVVAAGAPAAAPQVVQAPCNCLTKQKLADGGVLFQDICTKEAAIAAPQTANAQ